MSIQSGVYFRKGERPGRSLRIAFLRVQDGRNAGSVAADLGEIWTLLGSLQAGKMPDLPGATVPSGNLSALLGFGISAFGIPEARQAVPDALKRFGRFLSPRPAGGGPLLFGAGLEYDESVSNNEATEHFIIQLIADTELATSRAIVEIWKLLADKGQEASLSLGRVFDGFQRDDGRSWLDFHDGVSNLKSGDERRSVLEVKDANVPGGPDRWTVGGTYLAFIRFEVDLRLWRGMPRTTQEALVGRDKLTGCPIVRLDDEGRPVTVAGCPMAGTADITAPGNTDFIEPDDTADATIRVSHVQRANRHVGAPEQANSLRIYRQGFEFFEQSSKAPGFRVGLNFVSFQDTPQRLVRLLTQPDWLGNTNFGGAGNVNPRLLLVHAGGIYFAPGTSDDEPFPGARVLVG